MDASNPLSPTKAWQAFSRNLDRLTAMVAVMLEQLRTEAEELKQERLYLQERLERLEAAGMGISDHDEREEEEQTKLRRRYLNTANDFFDEWHIVMLVTFAETYLEDALAECAERSTELMARSEQMVTYQDVTVAQSVEAVLDEMRHRWARNFVNDGGPRRWMERLERMGARGYPTDTTPTLEEVWGIRHVVVHSAGRVTRDFARRHPSFKCSPGEAISIDSEKLAKRYGPAVLDFVRTTDEFFVRRYFSTSDRILSV